MGTRVCDRGPGPDGAHSGRADREKDRPVVVACARIAAGRTRLGRDYGELAAGYGAAVSERPDGLLLAVFSARPGDGGSALEPALEMALAWRRRSRDTGHGAPAIAVVSAENDATVSPHPGTDAVDALVERVIGLVGRTSPGAVSVE